MELSLTAILTTCQTARQSGNVFPYGRPFSVCAVPTLRPEGSRARSLISIFTASGNALPSSTRVPGTVRAHRLPGAGSEGFVFARTWGELGGPGSSAGRCYQEYSRCDYRIAGWWSRRCILYQPLLQSRIWPLLGWLDEYWVINL